MNEKIFNIQKYAACARQVVAEGVVLLENRDNLMPLAEGTTVALFGRSQFNYFKSGTGSGGMVNAPYITGIKEAIEQYTSLVLNKGVLEIYEEWLKDNPFDEGVGWANEPWFQKEMPLSEDLVRKAKEESDVAILIIGRTAGEDKDNSADPGSYHLTNDEHNILNVITSIFDKVIVLLNVGNVIDMKWVDTYKPNSVMYCWQGGQEGGSGVTDVLMGSITPSGKLANTIAYHVEDHPSHEHYGDDHVNEYVEDIYVGYRYFETFAKDKVMYPFGFGLSYTTFDKKLINIKESKGEITITVKVVNTGAIKGKEVVQFYVAAPQGKLGKPIRALCGFGKTAELAPGERDEIIIVVSKYYIASFDDSGITGHKNSFVLEAGTYDFYLGDDVRIAKKAFSITLDELVIMDTVEENLAPVVAFNRMIPGNAIDEDSFAVAWEQAPLAVEDPVAKRNANLPADLKYTGDKGYKLTDVADGKVSMHAFIAQLSDEDLCCIVRGEGMCSEKVTPGTGGAFGGVTDSLLDFGIPVACITDGPSGVRMDCGTIAFSLPNGATNASTFNLALQTELYEYEGLELRKHHVDMLTGPGMNIHRHPFNGRNFEYFSEDPFITGKMAAAQLNGLHKYGVTGTVKHFACNNQEHRRNFVETVISGRAIREIYLRGFEITVKETDMTTVMTTYAPINGYWTASSYELCTNVLRKEWGFQGLVMTDWWAKGNDKGEEGTLQNVASMIRAQNDLQMVTRNSLKNSNHDNSAEALKAGTVTRGEYQLCAANICSVIIGMPVFTRYRGIVTELDTYLKSVSLEDEGANVIGSPITINGKGELDIRTLDTNKCKSNSYQLLLPEPGNYKVSVLCYVTTEHEISENAQLPYSVFWDGKLLRTVTLTAKDRTPMTYEFLTGQTNSDSLYLKLYFSLGGIVVNKVEITLIK